MVKHSPIDRLRQIHQQRNIQAEVHDDPNAIHAAEELPPVGEALRRAAEVRAEADALDRQATDFEEPVDAGDGVPLHPNVNARRRGRPEPDLQDPADDLGASFMEDMPATPPPWLSQVINAAVTAAAAAVAAMPQRPAALARASLAPTKLSDRKVPDFWESKPEEWFRIFDAQPRLLQAVSRCQFQHSPSAVDAGSFIQDDAYLACSWPYSLHCGQDGFA